jgi:hypothetical protein
MTAKPPSAKYTCADYRLEMMLLGLERQLRDPEISEDQKEMIRKEAYQLRNQLDMD